MRPKRTPAQARSRPISGGDLSLTDLHVLLQIHRSGRLADAEDVVGLSQPSISARLAHLRVHFSDPLFTRGPGGMLATPRMESLVSDLHEAARLLEKALSQEARFEPESSQRVFRLCLTEVGQQMVLPRLTGTLQSKAPGCRLEVHLFDDATPAQLESGKVDLAVGALHFARPPTLRFQRLAETDFMCISRTDHPRVDDQLSTAEYLQERHVAFIHPGRSEAAFDRMLRKAGLPRRVVMTVPSSATLGEILKSSELLSIVPRIIGEQLIARGGVKAVALPIAISGFLVNQYWHERFHNDGANVWLRRTIFATQQ